MCAGLVSRVVDDSKVADEAMKVAEKIASLSRPVIAIGKKFFYSQVELPVHDAYRSVNSQNVLDFEKNSFKIVNTK